MEREELLKEIQKKAEELSLLLRAINDNNNKYSVRIEIQNGYCFLKTCTVFDKREPEYVEKPQLDKEL
jgi:hypothetical protein